MIYRKIICFYLIHGMETTESEIRVTINKEGSYSLPFNQVTFHLPENEQRKLIINGIEQDQSNRTFDYKLN